MKKVIKLTELQQENVKNISGLRTMVQQSLAANNAMYKFLEQLNSSAIINLFKDAGIKDKDMNMYAVASDRKSIKLISTLEKEEAAAAKKEGKELEIEESN